MNTQPTFRTWLLSHTDQNDHLGDLARDAAQDTCWTGTTAHSFLAHLIRHHTPSHPAVLAADTATDLYHRLRKAHR